MWLSSSCIGRGMRKGIDYDREVGRVKISVKEVVPDFIMPMLSLALEVKLIKTAGQRVRRVVDEINADIASYSKGYDQLLFVVYDLVAHKRRDGVPPRPRK